MAHIPNQCILLSRYIVTRASSRQSAPKFFSQVDVFVNQDDGTERLVTTLNLDKLGWSTNIKRLVGKISDIYVIETPDDLASHTTDATLQS